jgi:hypothetical protein
VTPVIRTPAPIDVYEGQILPAQAEMLRLRDVLRWTPQGISDALELSETNHRPVSSLEGRPVLPSHLSVDGIRGSHRWIWLVDASDRPARLVRADRRDQPIEERDTFIPLSSYHFWRVGAAPFLTLPVPWPAVEVHRIPHSHQPNRAAFTIWADGGLRSGAEQGGEGR